MTRAMEIDIFRFRVNKMGVCRSVKNSEERTTLYINPVMGKADHVNF